MSLWFFVHALNTAYRLKTDILIKVCGYGLTGSVDPDSESNFRKVTWWYPRGEKIRNITSWRPSTELEAFSPFFVEIQEQFNIFNPRIEEMTMFLQFLQFFLLWGTKTYRWIRFTMLRYRSRFLKRPGFDAGFSESESAHSTFINI